EAAAVSHSEHSLGGDLVRDAQARSKIGEVILHVSLKIHVAKAGYVDQPGAEVQPSAISLPRYRLGEINFPSQSIVEDKFASNPKSILAIEVQSSLTF